MRGPRAPRPVFCDHSPNALSKKMICFKIPLCYAFIRIAQRIHACSNARCRYSGNSANGNPVMEYLYTVENIKMALGTREDPGIPLADCSICSALPANVSKVNVPAKSEFGAFPNEVAKLEEFILVKYTWQILKCPICGRLYTDEYHYESLVGGGEDEYLISRIEYNDALELLKGIKAKKLIREGSRWLVSW